MTWLELTARGSSSEAWGSPHVRPSCRRSGSYRHALARLPQLDRRIAATLPGPSRAPQAASIGTWSSRGPSGRMDGCIPPASLRIGGAATRTGRSARGLTVGGGGSGCLGRSSPGREGPVQTRLGDVPGAERQALAPETPWHTLSAEQVLQAKEADPRHGLSLAEAASRADRFGLNTLAAGRAEPRWRAFIRQYSDPMQIVLLVAGLLSLFPLRQLGTGLLLILLTLANAVLGLHQEGEAESAVAALQRRLIVTARVRRDGQEAEIPAEQLVPGDIVSIEAGDVVPADGRLLRAAMLEVAESELTGESLPVSKGTAPVREADMPLGDRTDMVYMNTSVTRGTGEFVVTATGMATEVGHISGMLQAQPTVKTPLTRQLDRLSKQLLLVAGVALIASMAVNLSRGYTFNAVLPAAVAFAIAAVPVQLPMVVTTILAWGTRALVKVGAIMKQLPSTETLGSTSAINTDKTGTLTLNQMTAVQMVVAGHRYG